MSIWSMILSIWSVRWDTITYYLTGSESSIQEVRSHYTGQHIYSITVKNTSENGSSSIISQKEAVLRGVYEALRYSNPQINEGEVNNATDEIAESEEHSNAVLRVLREEPFEKKSTEVSKQQQAEERHKS
ncbi:hypothetical protein DICVIV_06287 [Dictyocaulus viviparus]|uniref:DRBM domain-containing protein n=1 Tax=Dictyocaulus viviparus TaxID=29172 RepID=A0A0D8XSJ9_DICVI|nr:hypothetical protein DICVIV_06287 [Dictyocaulus viviparus]